MRITVPAENATLLRSIVKEALRPCRDNLDPSD
jgi:hypothetical protein